MKRNFPTAFLLYHTVPAGTSKDRVKFAYHECGHRRDVRKADLIKAKGDPAGIYPLVAAAAVKKIPAAFFEGLSRFFVVAL